jgi:diguanylate cyclase (GGDEF)-like protein
MFYKCAIWRDIVSHLAEEWTHEDVSHLRGIPSVHGPNEISVVVVTSFDDPVYWEHWMGKHADIPVFQFLEQAGSLPVRGMADFLTEAVINDGLLTRLWFGAERMMDMHKMTLTQEKMRRDRIIQMELNDRLLKVSVELKEAKERIEELSMTDALTQVKNRRFFDFQLERDLMQAARYKTALSIFIMDIDNFKMVNDTYGHQVGDEVLIRLGGIIRHCLRDTDWAARYGGEEFVVALPMTGEDGALKTAERLRERVENELSHLQDHKMTVSVGVATFLGHTTKAELIRKSDESLYKAKKTGKNKVMYFNETQKEYCEFPS